MDAKFRMIGGVVGAAVLIAIGTATMPAVQDGIVTFFVQRQIGTDPASLETDGLRVILCGIAPPSASPHARSCTAVIAGGL